MTKGNVKKSTDNRGHPVWVSKLDQGSRQADASLWLTLVLLFMNVFYPFFSVGPTSGRPQEAPAHHLRCPVDVIMLDLLSCEWKQSIHLREQQQLVKIKSDRADEGD